MRLPDPKVDHEVWEGERTGVQRNLDALALAMPGFGDKSVEIRFGVSDGTWPGGTLKADNTPVFHGLGRTPVAVIATVTLAPSVAWFPVVQAGSYSSTIFQFTAVTSDGSSPVATTSYSIAWIAIG